MEPSIHYSGGKEFSCVQVVSFVDFKSRKTVQTMSSYDDVDWMSAAATFPQKLYALSVHEFDQKDSSVVWCAEGTAFRVKDPEAFEKNVLNKYFKRKMTFIINGLSFILNHILSCFFLSLFPCRFQSDVLSTTIEFVWFPTYHER